MKKRSVLALSLLTAVGGVGCSSSSNGGTGTAGGAGMGGLGAVSGMAGASVTGGSAGTGGASVGGSGGSGGMCDIASLEVFARSDTDQSWDDNDFSDVVLDGTCPKLVNVTWPHEAGWQNADPADANHESTHFTLDSASSADLSNKKLTLTIALAADQRGPNAQAGGYAVSLVSVSTFDRVIATGGAGAGGSGGSSGALAGGAGLGGSGGSSGSLAGGAGLGGSSGSSGATGGVAGSAGTSGATAGGGTGGAATGGSGGADSTGGTAGAAVTTETGYSEAESPVAERVTLRRVGDQATVSFTLPKKTTDVASYDPARAIKINIRIYSLFSDGTGGTGGTGGMSGAAGAGMSGAAGMSADRSEEHTSELQSRTTIS